MKNCPDCKDWQIKKGYSFCPIHDVMDPRPNDLKPEDLEKWEKSRQRQPPLPEKESLYCECKHPIVSKMGIKNGDAPIKWDEPETCQQCARKMNLVDPFLNLMFKEKVSTNEAWEEIKYTEPWISIEGVLWDVQAKQMLVEGGMKVIYAAFQSLLSSQKKEMVEKVKELRAEYVKGGTMTRTGRFEKTTTAKVAEDLQSLIQSFSQ